MDKKIKSKNAFLLMQIVGLIGLDTEIESITATTNPNTMGLTLMNILLTNAYKAQPQIEELIENLTDKKINNAMDLLEGLKQMKEDKQVVSFFTKFIETMI